MKLQLMVQVYEAKKRSVQSHFQNLLRLEQRLLRMRQKGLLDGSKFIDYFGIIFLI